MEQRLVFTDTPSTAVDSLLAGEAPKGKIYILADTVTAQKCLPLLKGAETIAEAETIVVANGDANKSLESLASIWTSLSASGATRSALLINLGGGMITDLGGFAAATFKRGIRCINIPTTLLGAVDAAVGGKTGINFAGLKNEVGCFRAAEAVVISPAFYSTLPATELLSGYGEVLKHALIDSPEALAQALSIAPAEATPDEIAPILQTSVQVKRRIVEEDPFEHGIRRALNLGHTAAHAFESLALQKGSQIPHGIAVAHGLVVDLVLSHLALGFDSKWLHSVAGFVKEYYPAPTFGCKDYPALIAFMRHDKKNASADSINFTLLAAPGDIRIDCIRSPKEIETALDIARDLLGA